MSVINVLVLWIMFAESGINEYSITLSVKDKSNNTVFIYFTLGQWNISWIIYRRLWKSFQDVGIFYFGHRFSIIFQVRFFSYSMCLVYLVLWLLHTLNFSLPSLYVVERGIHFLKWWKITPQIGLMRKIRNC